MSIEQVQELERNIKASREVVEFGSAIERLRGNRDFKKVVMEGYFEKEAIRLVLLKAHPATQKPEHQAGIVQQIDAIGALHQYFNTALHKADLAAGSIAADEQTREELAAEDLSND